MKIEDLFESNIIDNVKGWGAVPDNQEVDYKGLRVQMKSKTFLNLAAPLEKPVAKELIDYMSQGGAIGSPFLIISFPPEWRDGDFSQPATIVGHEGRNRMMVLLSLHGNKNVEVHLFFTDGIRNRHLTPEIIQNLNKNLVRERSKQVLSGPFFEL